ncbi:NUDIX domain-containing protein [Ruegeria sp. R13_0]|uniref:NUDIX domain-containing protein n=1 Tax=Ruegeria sp. R13_0 TaxID=2821099 RepID=UPI001ADB586E|nr:NUDIX domain-containing protein [Ruegeria sp. R13_0]MBO9436379.1 NUDIX domain-containing protein [Ruegeria sp. R13_0]
MPKSEIFRPISERVLASDWGVLTKYEFDLRRQNGEWQRQTREAYDRGNGATCLLHNPDTDQVLLTRQFRLPVFLNGGLDGFIETPAGLLDGIQADERMRKELEEETGYQINKLIHLFDVYMSPGSVTEYLSFFKGTYSASNQTGNGGGSFDEGEDIEVLHVPLSDAMQMITEGEIRDAKTIILLQHLTLEKLTGTGDN